MSASALARAWPASVSFFPAALARWRRGAVAHKGSPPLLSGFELGGWSRGAWLLAPWAHWRRRRVGGVDGRWAIDDLGQDVAGVLWGGVHCPSRLGPAEDPPLAATWHFGWYFRQPIKTGQAGTTSRKVGPPAYKINN